MIVVDASAVCAILLREDEAPDISTVLYESSGVLIGPIQIWEAAVAVELRLGPSGLQQVESFLGRARVDVATIDAGTTAVAFSAWRRFGKGRHPARLNLGDCFAYALAKSRNLPLLYKGRDFGLTDLKSAL